MLPHVSALIVGHQLRLKHVGALTNKKIVQQVGVKFYICNYFTLHNTRCSVYLLAERWRYQAAPL